eukprot:COSAG01_NODE_621_length_14780_cov_1056.278591_14_plen_316_part_00
MSSNKKIKIPLIKELPVFLEQTNLSRDEKDQVIVFTKKHEKGAKGLLQSIISVVLTFIGAFIVGLSTLFFIAVTFPKNIEITILITSIIIYFIPGLFFKRINNHLLGNTLVCISSMTACFSIFENIYLFLVWFCMNLIGLAYSNSRFLTVFLVGISNLMTAFFLISYSPKITGLLSAQLLTVSNLILLVISYKTRNLFSLIKQHYLAQPVKIVSLISFFSFLFTLSFLKTSSPYEYFSYNVIYFLLSTGFLVWSFKHDFPLYRGLAILSWFSFLFYKYYDLLWKLLHKSASLIIFGLIFICIGIVLNKRANLYAK